MSSSLRLRRKTLAKKITFPCREFMKGMCRVITLNKKIIQYYAIYNSSYDSWLYQDDLWGDLTDFYGNDKMMRNVSMRHEEAIKEGHIYLVPCDVYVLIKVIKHVEHTYMFLDMDATGSFKVTENY